MSREQVAVDARGGGQRRPITFHGEEVRAILDGRKTQARRPIRPQPDADTSVEFGWYAPLRVDRKAQEFAAQERWGAYAEGADWPSPFGGKGDCLWVREGFYAQPDLWARGHGPQPILYCADAPGEQAEDYARKASIQMPGWAARIVLEVAGVRAQRLWEISYADTLAEGWDARSSEPISDGTAGEDARAWFRAEWDSVYVKRGLGWDGNPWVWAVSFKAHAAAGRDR